MALNPPAWVLKAGATPTLKGWVVRGEVIKAQRITQEELDAWWGVDTVVQDINTQGKVEAAMAEFEAEVIADNNGDGVIDELESMTKVELEELGREHGVELDRRKSKSKLIETMRSIITK